MALTLSASSLSGVGFPLSSKTLFKGSVHPCGGRWGYLLWAWTAGFEEVSTQVGAVAVFRHRLVGHRWAGRPRLPPDRERRTAEVTAADVWSTGTPGERGGRADRGRRLGGTAIGFPDFRGSGTATALVCGGVLPGVLVGGACRTTRFYAEAAHVRDRVEPLGAGLVGHGIAHGILAVRGLRRPDLLAA